MKCKVALGGLAVIGVLALSASGAQAGAGGSPTTLLGFFVCHATSGPSPAGQFDVESPVFGPHDANGDSILQRVKIGKAALACAFARLFPAVPKGAPAPDPIEPNPAEQMTCYPISLSTTNQNDQGQRVPPPPKYMVFGDPLGRDPRLDVPVPPTGLQFLCVPGAYFQQ